MTDLPPIGSIVRWGAGRYEVADHNNCGLKSCRNRPFGLDVYLLKLDGTRRYKSAQCIDARVTRPDTNPEGAP